MGSFPERYNDPYENGVAKGTYVKRIFNFYSNAIHGEFSSHYSANKNIAFVTGES